MNRKSGSKETNKTNLLPKKEQNQVKMTKATTIAAGAIAVTEEMQPNKPESVRESSTTIVAVAAVVAAGKAAVAEEEAAAVGATVAVIAVAVT